jgi:hypothetical protein
MKPNSPVDRHQCSTCGIVLPRYSKAEKCRSCHQAAVKADGLSRGHCVDCGKQLRNPTSARCRTCWAQNSRRSTWQARSDDWQPRGGIAVTPSQTTSEQRAYAAGMVDGEGHIGLTHWGSSFLPIVVITNTDKRMIDWFAERFSGGRILRHDRTNDRHRARYNWRIEGRRAYAFLREIEAYLVGKLEQASLVFAYYDGGGYFHHGSDRLPAEEVIRRAQLHVRLKALNARGPRDEPDSET